MFVDHNREKVPSVTPNGALRVHVPKCYVFPERGRDAFRALSQ